VAVRVVVGDDDDQAPAAEVLGVLSGVSAVRLRPADLVDPPGIAKLQMLVLTGQQPARLLGALEGERLEALYVVALSAGLRRGELLALRWKNVDLNRGGDRQGNRALWWIVMSRLRNDPRTQQYARRRSAEGKSNREIIRCLKRYVAREVFAVLTAP
jgi:transposase